MPSSKRQPSDPELVRDAEERVRRLYRRYQDATGDRRRRLRRRVEVAIERLRALRAEAAASRGRRARLETWFSSLGRGVKTLVAVVIAAGAVATAIGAILALWPDPPAPTVELRAELSDLVVDENVTLDEYTIRHQELDGSSAPSPVERRQLAALTVAQEQTDPGTETGTTQTETTGTESTETETTETETTETETETTETGTTGTETVPTEPDEDDDDIVVSPELSDEARKRLREAVLRTLGNPGVAAPIDVGEACADGLADSDCGLSSELLFMKVGEDSSPTDSAERLAQVLSLSRTQPAPTGRPEVVGATVNYRISLTGFDGRQVDVRWELHRPGGPPLAHEWLRNQRAALLNGEAEKDSASPYFWIPLPEDAGPFFVRLTAIDEDGVPLARADTPRFR